MNLFRLIAFALLVWIGWILLKNHLAGRRKTSDPGASKRVAGRVVKCRQCDLHLPEADAMREGDDWFCCQAHRKAWLAHQ